MVYKDFKAEFCGLTATGSSWCFKWGFFWCLRQTWLCRPAASDAEEPNWSCGSAVNQSERLAVKWICRHFFVILPMLWPGFCSRIRCFTSGHFDRIILVSSSDQIHQNTHHVLRAWFNDYASRSGNSWCLVWRGLTLMAHESSEICLITESPLLQMTHCFFNGNFAFQFKAFIIKKWIMRWKIASSRREMLFLFFAFKAIFGVWLFLIFAF